MVPSYSMLKGSAEHTQRLLYLSSQGGWTASQDNSRTWHHPCGTSFVGMKNAGVTGS